ncbi:MAG TPA: formylglycine-generating enzyme family protein, partial [Saprospiraceae bacterium]|nr:formylglycine-generating enzyme family protein [Saprospiraceae bacterium]
WHIHNKQMRILISFIIISIISGCTQSDIEEIANASRIEESITPCESVAITPDTMMKISAGSYMPLYGKDSALVSVSHFYIDVYPVTNHQYLQFVISHPGWRRSLVKDIFADGQYLNDWVNDTSYHENLKAQSPVTTVSWFAARAYCECLGKRLPTIDEWEYVAMADETNIDARTLDTYNQYILHQYEKPHSYLGEIGEEAQNIWGLHDLHGLVWEWTEDFNSVMISGESRKDGINDPDLFCGSGSLGAKDLMNYAAFMRYAFRGSVKANYSIRNLGFRCAKDIKANEL